MTPEQRASFARWMASVQESRRRWLARHPEVVEVKRGRVTHWHVNPFDCDVCRADFRESWSSVLRFRVVADDG